MLVSIVTSKLYYSVIARFRLWCAESFFFFVVFGLFMVCAETGSFCTYILFVRSCQFFTVWLYCFMRVRFIFTIRSLLRGCARRCRCSIHCLRCGFRTRLCLRFRIKKCCLCGFPCWLRFFFFSSDGSFSRSLLSSLS